VIDFNFWNNELKHLNFISYRHNYDIRVMSKRQINSYINIQFQRSLFTLYIKMILLIFGYIFVIGLLKGGIVICKIQTDTMIREKDSRLVNAISDDQNYTAISCINKCVLYTPQCRSVSFSHSERRCLLHMDHPHSSTAQLTSAAGFSLYYSLTAGMW
jgi:hypothetical protein